jgi:hypothetical protein
MDEVLSSAEQLHVIGLIGLFLPPASLACFSQSCIWLSDWLQPVSLAADRQHRGLMAGDGGSRVLLHPSHPSHPLLNLMNALATSLAAGQKIPEANQQLKAWAQESKQALHS